MNDKKEINIQQIKEKIMNTFNNENQFYDLTELLNLNIREMKKEDLNDFSDWLYKEIESKDLFNKYEGSSNPDNLVDIYNKLFLFVTKQYNINYSTFFSELSYRNLNNLKNAYFSLFSLTEGKSLDDFFIKKVIEEKIKFRNDFLVTTEILNLENINFEIKKRYIDNNETFLNTRYLTDGEAKDYYLKKYSNNSSKKYRITI